MFGLQYAAGAAVVAEYLRALVLTGRLADYAAAATPDKGEDHRWGERCKREHARVHHVHTSMCAQCTTGQYAHVNAVSAKGGMVAARVSPCVHKVAAGVRTFPRVHKGACGVLSGLIGILAQAASRGPACTCSVPGATACPLEGPGTGSGTLVVS